MAETRIDQRPQYRNTSNVQPLQVTARPVSMGGNIRPADNSDLSGLMQGLQAFNPALQQFARNDQAQKQLDNKAAQVAGEAAAQREERGLPLDLTPTPDAGFQGTAQSVYQDAFRRGITARTAQQTKQEALAQYNEQKDLPDFNVDGFLGKLRSESLAGLSDDMAGPMGASLGDFEGAIRGNYEKVRLDRLNGAREANISALLRDGITTVNADSYVDSYFSTILPAIKGQGKTAAEGAQYLLNHLDQVSTQAGGSPELFDALLTEKDATGKTIADYNPAMLPRIQAARSQAASQLSKAVEAGAQEGNAFLLKEMDEKVAMNPHAVTFDDVLGLLGTHAPFKTDNEVMSYWRGVQKARGEAAGQMNLLSLAKIGQLYMAEEKDQKAIMGSLTGSVLTGLSGAIESGDTSGIAALTDVLVASHNTAGSTVPSGAIERMFKFIGQTIPKEGEPTPIFKAAAEVYRRLESAPQLRTSYFDEKSRKVMDAYVSSLEGQVEPTAAYKDAYVSISPEAERRAEAFKQTPAYKENVSKVLKEVTGSSFWPRMLGGNGRPENAGQIVAEAQQWSLDYLKRNPSATDDQVEAARSDWAARSFVLDKNTGVAVKVPAGIAPQLAQEALSAYTEKLAGEYRIADRGDGWSLTMIPSNTQQGTYRVGVAVNGALQHLIGEVNIQELITQHRKDTLFLPEDAKVLRDAELAVQAGQPLTNPALPLTIAKARQLGVMGPLVKLLEDREVTEAQKALSVRPKFDAVPDTSVLFKNDRQVKADPKLTVSSAQRLLNTASGGSTGLAASLITMGEAVMLQAYDDPAKGAGKNIAMGYNLKANEANAPKDLKAAGVPADLIQGVIEGTARLSPEQAERLTVIAVGRYERLAADQVNRFQPRMWEKLQPQQRAVLTDIAYQTGNVGQFKKALTSLVNGDLASFKEESKVNYTNRKGERVEDKRRNELRNSMLAGTSYWQSVLVKQGAQPGLLDTIVATQ